ncbi:amino acid ABC transporter membrane protein, PAAT family (TC 3.A.1.3.-) [Cognatiyoonia koreensis]|uniref:Amino acid ABC transporter membrane protein, PAAT family (TC 3.A.1.3.-) n=1 Tax=Cognatiyoonia koreensis TaxID=364200 RepID=A0A1I0QKQ8_9RHOB|nr:amino acid ABC transporter permease [Cognatiyoonia koreensis]SEW27580.1 amino acid ABC transporter membrane protein, PAAT family (TC 3.A.1.3.-) [Cognatiyoonia koreensis]
MLPTSPDDKDFPWWLLIVAAIGIYLFAQVLTDDTYTQVLVTLMKGLRITVFVALVSYILACALGLVLALMATSQWLIWRQIARLYVEVMRGIPIIVLLLYVAFVLAPALVALIGWVQEALGFEAMRTRDFSLLWRAVIALTLAYASFLAEVFRAGLQSVDHGQIEAAEALGLNKWQRLRHIVLPQALRTVLPPLGNDFVAMVKDSSLVSVLGVTDITQLGKVTAAGNFRYFETYNIVALLYLTMTIGLSILLRNFERRMRQR